MTGLHLSSTMNETVLARGVPVPPPGEATSDRKESLRPTITTKRSTLLPSNHEGIDLSADRALLVALPTHTYRTLLRTGHNSGKQAASMQIPVSAVIQKHKKELT